MLSRRTLLAASAAPMAAAPGPATMSLSMHQATSAGSDFRAAVEGYARAGFRFVEVIPPLLEPFVRRESAAAARRLLGDLGLKPVSCGGVRGLFEPGPQRAAALAQLPKTAELAASIGVNRIVCPCGTSEKFTEDDYQRALDNLREAGDAVKPFGVVAMLEFMRGSTFIGTLPTALHLTRRAGHPNVRPMLDCYHFWAGLSKFEDLDLIEPAEIHHVHFQDVPDMPRELLDLTTRAVPGEGVSPLVRILVKLKEKRYSGPLSVELFAPQFQKGDPFEVAAHIREKAEPILRQAGVL